MASQAFSSSVPQAASFSPKPHDNIFPTPYWRDLWAAVLYYVSLAAFLALAGLNINYLVHNGGPVTSFSSLPEIQITLITQGVVLLVASLLTALYVFLLYKFTEGMIKFSFLGTGVIMIIMGAISLFTGLAIHGVIMLVFAALQFLLYFFWRSRIPFSAALLRNALKITSEYPAIIVVAFLSFFTTLSLVAICLASMTGLAVMSEKEAYSKGFIKASGLYSLFSFLWSCGVIENVGAVTISGVFATRYFLGKQQALVVNPTSESFKRAMTYSFGSICFGSLLVAIVQFLKALVDSSNDRNSLAGAIISCLLGLIRDLLAYFNKYAFTHIAIYGKPYLEAGKVIHKCCHFDTFTNSFCCRILGSSSREEVWRLLSMIAL